MEEIKTVGSDDRTDEELWACAQFFVRILHQTVVESDQPVETCLSALYPVEAALRELKRRK